MRKFIKPLIFIFVFMLILAPALSFAQGTTTSPSKGLIPCGTSTNPEPCQFKHFITLINTVIQFILFGLVMPISAIMFAYAGFLLLTSGGEASKKTKAKNIFSNVAIGLVIAIAAWLIIKTLLSILGYDGAWIGF